MEYIEKKYAKYRLKSDFALIDAILDGDMLAVEFLLSVQCAGGFFHLCELYRGSRMELEDLTQEMCMQLFQNNWKMLRNFRGVNAGNSRSCKLTNYIITCAARWMKRKNDVTVREIDWTSFIGKGDEQWIDIRDDSRDGEELRVNVIAAIMALPDSLERFVLLEYKIKDRPADEVARLLNLTTGAKGTVENVYTICSRGLCNLRKRLEKGDVYA